MKNRIPYVFKFIVVALLLIAGSHDLFAQCGNPVINGTFSTGDYTGWVPAHGANVINNGIERVSNGDGRLSLGIDEHISPSGTLASVYQQLRVPVQGGQLSFWYHSAFDGGTWPIVYSYGQAILTDTTNAPLATIFYTQTSDNPDTMVYFNMAPYAGKIVRLYFQAQLLYGPTTSGASCTFNVDNVNISAKSELTFNHCTLPIHDVVGSLVHTQPGVYIDTLRGATSYGCDSVVTSTISYSPVTYSQTITPYCPGTSISFAAGSHIHTAPGIYSDTVSGGSVNGCDSIITTTLAYYQPAIGYQYFNFCGSGIVTVFGHTYSPSVTSTYQDTLAGGAAHGCDSIIITHISVNAVPAAATSVSSITVNNGDSVNAINFSVANDSLYAQWWGSTDSGGIAPRGARSLPAFRAINNTNAPIVDTITVAARFRGYAYVPAGNAIVKFSLVQHRIIDTIYLPNNGRGAIQVLKSPVSDVAYILSYAFAPGNSSAKCIYVLDLVNDQIIRTINYSYPFIRYAGDTINYAGSMVISPDGNNLYIVGNTGFQEGSYLVKLNINTGVNTALPIDGSFDSECHGICITPDGRYIYLSHYIGYPIKVDAASMTLVSTSNFSTIHFESSTYISISPNGQNLYIGNRLNQLAVASTANDSVLYILNGMAISGYGVVQDMSFTPDSNNLLVMSEGYHQLYTRKINLATYSNAIIRQSDGDGFDYNAAGLFPNVSVTPDGREYYLHFTDVALLVGVSLSGGVNGNYGGIPFLGTAMGFGSVGSLMIPCSCLSPEISFTVTINPTMRYSQSFTLCPGGSATIAGHTHTSTGIYIDTLAHASMYGTDSIVTTQLTVLSYPTSYQALTFCGSGSITVGSIIHNSNGYYSDTLHAAAVNGCDSIVNTNLIIKPTVAAPSVTFNNQAVCAGSTVSATQLDVPSGGYHLLWTGSNAAIGLAAIGQDNVPSFTSVNNGNASITDTISVTSVNNGYIYVGSAVIGRISVLDRLTNTLVTNIIGIASPAGISVNPDGSRVYVASQTTDKLFVINGSANTIMTSINVGHQPGAVAVNTNANKVYVANYGAGTVSVVDTVTNTATETINVGTNPSGIAINPNGKYLYVTNKGSNNLSVISTASNTLVTTINVLNNPCGIAINAAGNRIYVVNQGSGAVTVIDVSTNTVIDTINVGNSPQSIALSIDGTRAYVSNFTDNTVSVINTGNNSVIGTVTVGTAPNGISVGPDGANVYVVDSVSHNLSVISTVSDTVIATQVVTLSSNTYGNFTSGSGCQSTPVKYIIAVNPTAHYTQVLDLCTGNSITVGTHTYNTTGTYTDTLHNVSVNGCDSIVSTQLIMHSPVTSTVTATICSGGNYGGHTATGTYVDHYNSIYGCDSARTLNLTVNVATSSTTNLTVCDTELPYVWNGLTFNSSGSQTKTGLTNGTGCDSSATLSLTVKQATSSTTNLAICAANLPYVWNGLTFNVAGSQTKTGLTNAVGCDSSATLNLTVNQSTQSITNYSICQSALPYVWNGLTFNGAGSQTKTGLSNAVGCDSSATLTLTVNTISASTTNLTICASQLPYQWNGFTFTGAGSQTKTGLTTSLGCDSSATLNLTVTQPTQSTTNQAVCQSALPYVWNGITFTSAGSQTAIGFTNTAGCDSTATLNLTVKLATSSTTNQSICQSALPYVWNGITFTSAGSQTAIGFTNTAGCDSTATLNLTVTQPTQSTTNQAVCQSALPYVWNGLTFTAAGSQTATGFTNAIGCDSAATLNLTVNQATSSNADFTLCQSALPYVWNGLTFTGAGSQTATGFTNAAGCDSSATLNLIVNAISASTSDLAICNADLPYSWNGLTFTAAGSQTKTGLTTGQGCDSTATLNLTVNQPSQSNTDLAICQSALPYVWNGLIFTAAGSQTKTGLTNALGCDSAATLNLTANTIDTSLMLSATMLTANETGAAYQWFDCSNNQPISGASSVSYTATVTGDYAVAITKISCTDTSECVHVVVTGLQTVNSGNTAIEVYPNPNNGSFIVKGASAGTYIITNELGQAVKTFNLTAANFTVNVNDLSSRVYFVTCKKDAETFTQKVVVIK